MSFIWEWIFCTSLDLREKKSTFEFTGKTSFVAQMRTVWNQIEIITPTIVNILFIKYKWFFPFYLVEKMLSNVHLYNSDG